MSQATESSEQKLREVRLRARTLSPEKWEKAFRPRTEVELARQLLHALGYNLPEPMAGWSPRACSKEGQAGVPTGQIRKKQEIRGN